MLRSIFVVKLVHTLIFFFLTGCNGILLYSAITGRIATATWIAFGFMVVEGVVLIANGWKCPLRTFAESLGADRGSVTDIFLPKWLADRIFPICGSILLLSTLLLAVRLLF